MVGVTSPFHSFDSDGHFSETDNNTGLPALTDDPSPLQECNGVTLIPETVVLRPSIRSQTDYASAEGKTVGIA